MSGKDFAAFDEMLPGIDYERGKARLVFKPGVTPSDARSTVEGLGWAVATSSVDTDQRVDLSVSFPSSLLLTAAHKAASSLAGSESAPIVLTEPGSLSSQTRAGIAGSFFSKRCLRRGSDLSYDCLVRNSNLVIMPIS